MLDAQKSIGYRIYNNLLNAMEATFVYQGSLFAL